MIEAGIYQKLIADAGVSGYVNGRVFGGLMPKDATLPCIVWQVINTEDLGYTSHGASGLRKKSFQFDSYAAKYMDCVKCSEAIRTLLQSYSGVLPEGSSVNGCIVVRDMDFPYEPGTSGYVRRRLLEIEVIYTETALPFVAPGSIYPVDDDSDMNDEGQL